MGHHRVAADSAVVSVRTSSATIAVGALDFAGRIAAQLSQEQP